jgi:hypothetical protein
VQANIAAFSEGAKARLNICTDFDDRRQFLLDYIDKIVYRAGTVSLHGSVPITLPPHKYPQHPGETPRIEFCIERTLDPRNGAQTCTAITNTGCAMSRYLRLWVVPPR